MTAWKEVKKAGCCSDLPSLPAECKSRGSASGSSGDANVSECVSTGLLQLFLLTTVPWRVKLGEKSGDQMLHFVLHSAVLLPQGFYWGVKGVAIWGCCSIGLLDAPAASPKTQVKFCYITLSNLRTKLAFQRVYCFFPYSTVLVISVFWCMSWVHVRIVRKC